MTAGVLVRPAPQPRAGRRRVADTGPGFVAKHRMLLIALVLVCLFHGVLLFSGSYANTYDAWVHIFFADHYRRSWFSSWEPRWYTGFTVVSYPPGSHQVIALFSYVVGLRAAFAVTQLLALLNLTIGVYRWSAVWVDQRSAGWAAILLTVSSSIAETVHVFGQLPTTFSLGFLLQSLPYAHRWVRTGQRRAFVLGVACTAATTACHHVTTLFGSVFFLGPVLLSAVVEGLRTPLPNEPLGHPQQIARGTLWPLTARRLARVRRPLIRACAYGGALLCALIIVVLPYWLWSSSDPITQVSIPHASRDNYLSNLNAGLIFWLVPWGTTLIILPYAFARGFASRAWPLAGSLALLTLLGTGGTTPLPAKLLGASYQILTLDRFTFWATITVLPLAGAFVTSVTEGSLRRTLVRQFGRRLAALLPLTLAALHLAFTMWTCNLTHYRPFQPASIDIAPITAFLSKDDHANWRYLTLGFGDQMAWLSANTTAATVDGDYHSARRLPELTSRPVERLEDAKFAGVPGIGSLQQFLAVPERYNLKYVFSNDQFYDPLLAMSGWTSLGRLDNGIFLWERADVPPLVDASADHELPAWERYLWGILPLTAIVSAGVLLAWSALGERYAVGLFRRRFPRIRRFARRLPPVHLGRWIDTRLAAVSARIPAGGPAKERWMPWAPLLERVRAARRPVAPRRRRLQSLAAVGVLGTLPLAAVIAARPAASGPTSVVNAYFERLDVRKVGDAYALLDPATRPDFVQYQLDLGADGGLLASYAKLSDVRSAPVSGTGGDVVVRATLHYLTSLQSYQIVQELTLRRAHGRWLIELSPADPTSPPDEFTSRPQVAFIDQGRRSLTSGATTARDVLDRPQLRLSDVSSLRVDGRWVVIGNVTNADVVPADVTVTAQLRNSAGTLLASWDASTAIVHKLLPGESTPFRVEFQSVAGTAVTGAEVRGGADQPEDLHEAPTVGLGAADTSTVTGPAPPLKTTVSLGKPSLRGPVEFDPDTVTPLTLAPGAVPARVDVYAKAVATPAAGPRGLQVLDAHVSPGANGLDLVGWLRNDSTVEATVPHLLLSYTDAHNQLVWVGHAYLASSIGPQREAEFRIPLDSPAGLLPSGLPTQSWSGHVHGAVPTSLDPQVGLPPDSGFTAVSVLATTYTRGSAP